MNSVIDVSYIKNCVNFMAAILVHFYLGSQGVIY